MSNTRIEFVEFRYKNEAGENGRGHNERLSGHFINKVERFRYVISVVQDNRELWRM